MYLKAIRPNILLLLLALLPLVGMGQGKRPKQATTKPDRTQDNNAKSEALPEGESPTDQGWGSPEPEDTLSIRRITNPTEIARIRRTYAAESRANPLPRVLLGDKAARDSLKAYLLSEDKVLSLQALVAMDGTTYLWGEGSSPVPNPFDADIYAALLALTEKGDERRFMAAGLLPKVDPVRASAKLLEMLAREGDLRWRLGLVAWLGDTAPTEETIEALGRLLQEPDSPEELEEGSIRRRALQSLANLLPGCTPELKVSVKRVVSTYPKLQGPYDSLAYGYYLANLATIATREDLRDLRDFWVYDRYHVYGGLPTGLIHSDPTAAREAMARQVRKDSMGFARTDWIVEAFGEVPEEGFRLLEDSYSLQEGPYGGGEDGIVDACWQLGGRSMVERFAQSVGRAERRTYVLNLLRYRYLPMDAFHPLRICAEGIADLGVLPAPIAESRLDSLRKNFMIGMDLVSYDGTTRDWFAHACGEFEVNYFGLDAFNATSNLVQNVFGLHAQGKLDGLECYVHTPIGGAFEDSYTWLIFKGKCYEWRGGMESGYGSGEDPLARALNLILEEHGVPERFVSFGSAYSNTMIFLRPEQAAKLNRYLGE